MATCAIAVLQPDGSYLLRIDPTVIDVTTCSYVVQSGADIANSLLTMSAADGARLSSGIISVWVGAWVIRRIISIINGSTTNETPT